MSEIPSKFTESVWIFLCDLPMYKVFTWGHFLQIKLERTNIFLTKFKKINFSIWWNGGQIPYAGSKTYFPQHKPSGFRYKTQVICIFYSM